MSETTADLIRQQRKRYEAARERYEASREALFALIRQALDEGAGPSEMARDAGFTREYVAKIRDGKTGPRSS